MIRTSWCILPPLFLSSPPTQTARRLPCAFAFAVKSISHSEMRSGATCCSTCCRHPGGGEPNRRRKMRKVLSLAFMAAGILSANAQMPELPNVAILKALTVLKPEVFYMGDREANYILNTALPYKGIRIVDPQVVDVIPISNRKITIVPASNTIGDTHLMFYDGNKN